GLDYATGGSGVEWDRRSARARVPGGESGDEDPAFAAGVVRKFSARHDPDVRGGVDDGFGTRAAAGLRQPGKPVVGAGVGSEKRYGDSPRARGCARAPCSAIVDGELRVIADGWRGGVAAGAVADRVVRSVEAADRNPCDSSAGGRF